MNLKEEERRQRLLKMRAERLPDIKKQFEAAQNRNLVLCRLLCCWLMENR